MYCTVKRFIFFSSHDIITTNEINETRSYTTPKRLRTYTTRTARITVTWCTLTVSQIESINRVEFRAGPDFYTSRSSENQKPPPPPARPFNSKIHLPLSYPHRPASTAHPVMYCTRPRPTVSYYNGWCTRVHYNTVVIIRYSGPLTVYTRGRTAAD